MRTAALHQTIQRVVTASGLRQKLVARRAGNVGDFAEHRAVDDIVVRVETVGLIIAHRIGRRHASVEAVIGITGDVGFGRRANGLLHPRQIAVAVVTLIRVFGDGRAGRMDHAEQQVALVINVLLHLVRVVAVHRLAGAEEDDVVVRVIFNFRATEHERAVLVAPATGQAVLLVIDKLRAPKSIRAERAGVVAILNRAHREIISGIVSVLRRNPKTARPATAAATSENG